MYKPDKELYEFSRFSLDVSERLLRRDGKRIPVTDKAFDTLCILVRRGGQLVGKDELMNEVWADSIVEENNLDQKISMLRQALGERKGKEKFIETVRGRGYRFLPEVRRIESQPPDIKELTAAEPIVEAEPEQALANVGLPRWTNDSSLSDTTVEDVDESSHSAAVNNTDPAARSISSTGPNMRVVFAVAAVLVTAVAMFALFRSSANRSTLVVAPLDSIAVLPFENAAKNVDAEYLSDGISESLIDRLSQLSGLKVASRSSSFRYKGKDQDTAQVGSELGVSAVLTGNVKQIGDDLVIAVRLDDARTDQHIWGEQYVRKFKDILSVQNEIAQDVTSNLRLKLTGADEQNLAKKFTQNTEAYQLYLKGNYEWNKHSREDIHKAIEYYEQALEKDSNFALAYAGLSGSYGVLGNVYLPPNENFPKAKAYAEKALALDGTIAHAHAAMGAVRLFYEWDWAGQEKEFKLARELEPNVGDAYQLYAEYLETAGRFDEALAEAQRAQEIDPRSAMFGTEVAFTFYYARRYDDAIAQCEKTLNLEPSYLDAYQYLGQSYEQKGMYVQAIATFQKGMAPGDHSPALVSSLGHAYAVSGNRSGAEKALAELRELSKHSYISPYLFAVVYAGLGNKDEAFSWLEKAFHDRASLLIWLKVEPQFDTLRADPRFQDLVERIGLNK